MTTIYDLISLYFKPYYQRILLAIILGIFIWTAYYAYNKWYPKPKPTADIYVPNAPKEASIYFFFADWCPHCKKAKPSWEAFARKHDGKMLNGSKLTCISVDCTEPDNAETTQMTSQFQVNSFPTIKMMKQGTIYTYETKITEANLEDFVKSV
jgi:thiol-disulfide isomerase/thioredoxin